jgi:hypothetical protein
MDKGIKELAEKEKVILGNMKLQDTGIWKPNQ